MSLDSLKISCIAAAVSALAAGISAYSAHDSNKQTEKAYSVYESRIKYSAVRDRNWNITLFQISGDSYIPEKITLTPFFSDPQLVPKKGVPFALNLITYLDPIDRRLIKLGDLRKEICEVQNPRCAPRDILNIRFEYKVLDSQPINQAIEEIARD